MCEKLLLWSSPRFYFAGHGPGEGEYLHLLLQQRKTHRCRTFREYQIMKNARRAFLVIAFLSSFIGQGVGPLGRANAASPAVVQNEAFGNSYGDWSVRWWQWLLSIPAATNPNLDGDCTQGQSGNVWFLAGSFFTTPAIRTCVIPTPPQGSNKKPVRTVFFPLINNIGFKAFGFETLNDLRLQAANLVDNVTNLVCTIDGTDCGTLCKTDDGNGCPTDLFAFRATSPSFSLLAVQQGVLPPGKLSVPGNADPIVSDGYWMLVTLPPGQHIIHFGGTSGNFSVNVTYTLTVP